MKESNKQLLRIFLSNNKKGNNNKGNSNAGIMITFIVLWYLFFSFSLSIFISFCFRKYKIDVYNQIIINEIGQTNKIKFCFITVNTLIPSGKARNNKKNNKINVGKKHSDRMISVFRNDSNLSLLAFRVATISIISKNNSSMIPTIFHNVNISFIFSIFCFQSAKINKKNMQTVF